MNKQNFIGYVRHVKWQDATNDSLMVEMLFYTQDNIKKDKSAALVLQYKPDDSKPYISYDELVSHELQKSLLSIEVSYVGETQYGKPCYELLKITSIAAKEETTNTVQETTSNINFKVPTTVKEDLKALADINTDGDVTADLIGLIKEVVNQNRGAIDIYKDGKSKLLELAKSYV